MTSTSLRTISYLRQMYSGHQRKATGHQIRSSKTTVLCMPSPHEQATKSPYRVRQFRNSTSASTPFQGRCHCWRDANAASYKDNKKQACKYVCNSSVAGMLREMQRMVNTGRTFEIRDFIFIILPTFIFLSFAQQVILIVASWLFSHGENHLDPESWENSGATRVSVHKLTRKTLAAHHKVRTARTPKVLKSC